MHILHAGFHGRRLLIWAEKETEIRGPRRAKPGRKPDNPDARPHPYDPGCEGLKDILTDIGIAASHCDPAAGKGVLWLPTKGEEPLPSDSLVGTPPPNQAKIRLAPWRTAVMRLGPSDAVELLCRCAGSHRVEPGVIAGEDVKFWTRAMRLAGSIVARQKFLPGIRGEGPSCRAVWEAVLTGDDAEAVSDLAGGMPASARAFADPQDGDPPEVSPRQHLVRFVDWTVDWLVRSSGSLPEALPRDEFESVDDAWFHALKTRSGELDWDGEEVEELRHRIQEWRRPISVAAKAPWRLCFRLEEPDVEDEENALITAIDTSSDQWSLTFLLQPHDDPSLRVPLAEIWNTEEEVLPALERSDADVREFALSALGRAAEICSLVDRSLQDSQPARVRMDAEEAYRFLARDARMLQQAGFGVFLPKWWTRDGARNRLKARATVRSPAMGGSGMMRLDSVVEFDWRLALGEHELELEELQRLADLKVPLVRVRGEWIEVDPDQISTALEFWRESRQQEGTVRDVVEMDVGAAEAADEIEVEDITAEGELAELIEELNAPEQFETVEVPEGFEGRLRPYQARGLSWLKFLRNWGLGGCLADDMGLGKTIQTLALVQMDREEGCTRPVLVVCPTSVVNNWEREAARFTPHLPVMVHHGSDREKGEEFLRMARRQGMIISSYGLLHRDIDFLNEIRWAGVVLDEAQNIKNPETKRAKAARSLEAEYRLALTGTPVQNHVGDLWSIMQFLNPGLLGSRSEFKRTFLMPIQSGSSPEAAEKLRRITRPFVLRREKSDTSIIQDLPEKMEMNVYCNLTEEQASLYSAVLEQMNRGLEGAGDMQRRGLVFSTLSKLKQICNHPAHFLDDGSGLEGRSGKLARLREMLEEIIEVGESALVFTQFRKMGDRLKTYLQRIFGREVLFLHGGVSPKKRSQMVDKFQSADDRIPVFILSLRAGGTGLNLTAASHVFHFDRWWNPAVEDQATDRAYRIGQDKNVEVHKFICAGTVEERIEEMIEQKKDVADAVVGSGEGWLTELSDGRLKEVFRLSREAVGE
ncbi:MAG: DEAD/DEAH box helicase [Candidatus Brocadiia bacterium]